MTSDDETRRAQTTVREHIEKWQTIVSRYLNGPESIGAVVKVGNELADTALSLLDAREAQPPTGTPALPMGEREVLHALIADFDAVTDPEEHPELNARAVSILKDCETGCVPLKEGAY